jgi:inner membrane protein
MPFFWTALFLLVMGICFVLKSHRLFYLSFVIYINLMLYLILDLVVGKTEWGWSFSTHAFFLFDVPTRYSPWILNFILHWTFTFELAILTVALWTYRRSNNKLQS